MPVQIKLKELRLAKGFSQNGLARALDMSLANVQKIEYNKAKAIPMDTLERICSALDCQIGDLLVLVGANPMSPSLAESPSTYTTKNG